MARLCRAAHSAVAVLAGLSTDNGAQEVSGSQLYQAYLGVRGPGLEAPPRDSRRPYGGGGYRGPVPLCAAALFRQPALPG